MTNTKKPDVIRVTRFIRDKYLDLLTGRIVTDNMSGITLISDIDYVKNIVTVGWSVCRGENFQKSEGIKYALIHMEKDPLIVELPESGVPTTGLVPFIFAELSKQRDNKNTMKFIRSVIGGFRLQVANYVGR